MEAHAMVSRTFGICVGLCLGISASSAFAFGVSELPAASATKYGGYVTDVFTGKFKERQVKFEVDIEKSTGVYEGAHGMIAVPAKGLNEEQVNKDSRTPNGAGLCNLYLSAPFRLLLDGKPAPESKLRIVSGLGNDGEQTRSACFICTVRQVAGGGRELCLFGAEKEPVLTAKFENVSEAATRDFTFTVAPDKDNKLSLVISIFGQSAAPVSVRYTGPTAPADDSPTSSVSGGNDEKAAADRKNAKMASVRNARLSAAALLQSDTERTGYYPDGKSLPKRPRIVWRYPAEGKGPVLPPGDPLVIGGVVYFGDEAGQLHAVNSADGSEKWVHDYGPHAIVAAPAVMQQKLYVASAGNIRCASCQTGEAVWSRDLPKSFGESSPLLVGDAVFVGCGDGFVRAFNRKTGEPSWEADLISDRPADLKGFESQYLRRGGIEAHMRSAASDGAILFQPIYDQSRIVALDCRTGQRRWTYGTRGWIPSHPTVAGDYVLFGAHDMYLHCVNRLTGKPVWKFPAGAEIEAAPAIGDGRVYFTSLNARLHCADLETGKPIWMHRMDPEVEGLRVVCAPIVTDDTVYIGATNGCLTAIDASTGNTRWAIALADNSEINSFALATDGKRLFVASRSMRGPQGQSGIFAVGD
jgi:outer membrane protein assembly factor BamB